MRLLLQGIEGMMLDKNKTLWLPTDPVMNKTDPAMNKTMWLPTAMNVTLPAKNITVPAKNVTVPAIGLPIDAVKNKTQWIRTDPPLNETGWFPSDPFNKTADPAMALNKTGLLPPDPFNKTADPAVNMTQITPAIRIPTKANVTAALDPGTVINTTIARASGLRLSGGGTTEDNGVGFGNVDAQGFNSVEGVQCATGLTQCNGKATCANLLSNTDYCGSCTTSCDFYTQVNPHHAPCLLHPTAAGVPPTAWQLGL